MIAETICSAVSAAGLGIAAITAYRKRFLAAARIAAYSLVPVALAMTGIVKWAANTAFSPMAWAGFGVLAVAWLLFMTTRAVERRAAAHARSAEPRRRPRAREPRSNPPRPRPHWAPAPGRPLSPRPSSPRRSRLTTSATSRPSSRSTVSEPRGRLSRPTGALSPFPRVRGSIAGETGFGGISGMFSTEYDELPPRERVLVNSPVRGTS